MRSEDGGSGTSPPSHLTFLSSLPPFGVGDAAGDLRLFFFSLLFLFNFLPPFFFFLRISKWAFFFTSFFLPFFFSFFPYAARIPANLLVKGTDGSAAPFWPSLYFFLFPRLVLQRLTWTSQHMCGRSPFFLTHLFFFFLLFLLRQARLNARPVLKIGCKEKGTLEDFTAFFFFSSCPPPFFFPPATAASGERRQTMAFPTALLFFSFFFFFFFSSQQSGPLFIGDPEKAFEKTGLLSCLLPSSPRLPSLFFFFFFFLLSFNESRRWRASWRAWRRAAGIIVSPSFFLFRPDVSFSAFFFPLCARN